MAWFRGYPLYAAHILVVVFVTSMIATALLSGLGGGAVLANLGFASDRVLRGEVWRIVTYGLVNPPSVWFLVDMCMIVWFGRDLERTLGRRKFLSFYGLTYLLIPLVYTAMGLWFPTATYGQRNGLALLVAFATLFPGAMFFFNIPAKWIAIAFVAINALSAVYLGNGVELLTILIVNAWAFLFIRFHQGVLAFPTIRGRERDAPEFRVVPDIEPRKQGQASARKQASMAEVDALLDKIAQYGIGSLTAQERARLDEAREHLRRDPRRN